MGYEASHVLWLGFLVEQDEGYIISNEFNYELNSLLGCSRSSSKLVKLFVVLNQADMSSSKFLDQTGSQLCSANY